MQYEQLIDFEVRPAQPQQIIDAAPFHFYTVGDGAVWTEFHRCGSNYLLRFPGLADFEVSADGSSVNAIPAEGTDTATVEHLYLNQLVPLALSRQGRPAYHASVVAVPGGAVAFLGRTGVGKSTLAASFAVAGDRFLTDDALLIEEANDGFNAAPSHASVRLWRDSAEAIVDDKASRASPISYSGKARLLAGPALAYQETPEKLVAAYLLGADSAAEIGVERLSGMAQYRAWLENSFLLDIEDKALLKAHFDWTHRISGSIPTYQLDYPRDYGMLGEVRETVYEHVASLNG